jgi:transglutaminase-like putative cysteine protease
MCRAEGVPSRTALGLVYAEVNKEPVLAYHMWTEVYIDGQWLAVDATLGRGGVGAGHVKITDHSWYDQRSLAPLLPVMRVMLAKPTVEVMQVEAGKPSAPPGDR